VKKRKRDKNTAVRKPTRVKHGILELTAHAIGSTLGGLAVKAGIVQPSSSKSKRPGKPAAMQPEAASKQTKKKRPRPKDVVTNARLKA